MRNAHWATSLTHKAGSKQILQVHIELSFCAWMTVSQLSHLNFTVLYNGSKWFFLRRCRACINHSWCYYHTIYHRASVPVSIQILSLQMGSTWQENSYLDGQHPLKRSNNTTGQRSGAQTNMRFSIVHLMLKWAFSELLYETAGWALRPPPTNWAIWERNGSLPCY